MISNWLFWMLGLSVYQTLTVPIKHFSTLSSESVDQQLN
jgi:hypothetical protein